VALAFQVGGHYLAACLRRTPPKPDEEREKEARRRQAAWLAISIIRKRGNISGQLSAE